MSRNAAKHAEITRAVREVAGGRARGALVMPAAEPHHSFHVRGEPGILWVELVPSQTCARTGGTRRQAARLAALGWRAPGGRHHGWHQYFHPTRKRHHRRIADHLACTFRTALGAPGELCVTGLDRTAVEHVEPTFDAGRPAAGTVDAGLLGLAERVLEPFQPDVFETHLELTVARKQHRVRIGLFARDGTFTCCALHLPGVAPRVAAAALAANDRLDRVAHSYALREVRGHGRSLVLQCKVSLLDNLRMPYMVGMLLYTTIEPLVDAHRALHR